MYSQNEEQPRLMKRIILFVFCCIVVALYSTSIFSNKWGEIKHSSSITTHGLWKTCYTKQDGGLDCFKSHMPKWMIVCQSNAVLGAILTLLSVILSALPIHYEKTSNRRISIPVILSLGALFMIVSLVTYAVQYKAGMEYRDHLTGELLKYTTYKLGWSYMAAWIGVIMAALTVVFSIYALSQKSERPKPQQAPAPIVGPKKPLIRMNLSI